MEIFSPQQIAKHWLKGKCLILDTETTGLGENDEIVEITIIDAAGKPLLNTLVKPSKPIPAAATAIHGITNAMVRNAPTWPEVSILMCGVIRGETVAVFNADYDVRLISQTDEIWGVKPTFSAEVMPEFACAMLVYAEFYGQKSERGGYKRQKLTAAAEQQGVKIEGTPHRALSDCLTTLGVIKAMAASDKVPVTLSAQSAVNTLQQLFKADKRAITALVNHRVECSEFFAGKTTATVGQRSDGAYVVGLIGIINALIFPDVIAAVYEGKELTDFTVADISAQAGDA